MTDEHKTLQLIMALLLIISGQKIYQTAQLGSTALQTLHTSYQTGDRAARTCLASVVQTEC